jgi:hypothetical protein
MKRFLIAAVLVVLLVFLSVRIVPSCASDDHDSVFTSEKLLTSKADELQSTVISPHLEAPIEPGRSVLWCATFQLAWNEVCALVGEDIHFVEEPPMVAILDKKSATKDDLDEASYVALAGFVRDGIYDEIPKALGRKFRGAARPHLLPDPAVAPRPQDIVAYAYLFKNLEFPTPFERLGEPLDFAGTRVECFGIGHEHKPDHQRLYPQVRILYYNDPDDFAVELRTKSREDHLILAKRRPAATLLETVAATEQQAVDSEPANAVTGDVLIVPKFNFDLTRSYDELLMRHLVVTNPSVAKDLVLLAAIQNIRFQMDEKGVRLRSESHMKAGAEKPPPARVMVFDKPFLVVLRREGAKTSYFALWVDNPELLVPYD